MTDGDQAVLEALDWTPTCRYHKEQCLAPAEWWGRCRGCKHVGWWCQPHLKAILRLRPRHTCGFRAGSMLGVLELERFEQ